MLIFIEYSFTGDKGRICYDASLFTYSEAKALIPEWLKEDKIEYDSYNIYQVLESLLMSDN